MMMSTVRNDASDSELIRQAHAGDRRAFDAIAARHWPVVYAIGMARLRDRDRAEDLAQEVFLRVYLLLERLDGVSQFSHWLLRIARNLAIDWQRRGESASRLLPMVPLDGLPNETVADNRAVNAREQAATGEQTAALYEALARLTDEQREIVLLHYMEGLSHRDIAGRLGVNQSTVCRHLSSALEQMRGLMDTVLREQAAALRAHPGACMQIGVIVAAVAVLPAATRASMVATAAAEAVQATAALAGGTETAVSLKTLLSLAKTKGIAGGAAKLIAAAAAVAILAIETFNYYTSRQLVPPQSASTGISQRWAAGSRPARSSPRTLPRPASKAPVHNPPSDGCLDLTGHVTLKGGLPAGGAAAELIKSDEHRAPLGAPVARAVADARGRFSISTNDSPYFVLRVSRAGAATQAVLLEDSNAIWNATGRAPGPRREVQSIELAPAAQITGRVETEDGQAVAGAIVRAANSAETSSTADGRFELDAVPTGQIELAVDDIRFVWVSKVVNAPAEGVVLRVSQGGGSIQGRVVLLPGSQGAGGATVMLHAFHEGQSLSCLYHPRTIVADSDGAFRFEHLAAGRYLPRAAKNALFQLPESLMCGPVGLREGESTSGLELCLYRGHTLTGRVTDKRTSAPIAGVTVTVRPRPVYSGRAIAGALSCVTGSDGTYRVAGVGNVERQVEIRAEKGGPATGKPLVTGQRTLRLDGTSLEVLCDIEIDNALTVSGIVTDAEHRPIPGADVSVVKYRYDGLRTARTISAADGSYAIEVPRFTPLRIQCDCAGFPPAHSGVLEITDQPVTNENIVVLPGGTLSGVVLDPAGKPVEGAVVSAGYNLEYRTRGTVTVAEGPTCSTLSDRNGEFVLEGVAPHEQGVSASHRGFCNSAWEQVDLQPNETISSLTLRLRTAHFIAGKVVNEAGEPVDSVQVCAMKGGVSAVWTNAAGQYRLDDLGNEPCKIYVNEPAGFLPASLERVEVDRSDADIVLRKQGTQLKPAFPKTCAREKGSASLSGRVVEQTNQAPLAGAIVMLYGVRTHDYEIGGQPAQTATTGADGRFRFRELQKGKNFIVVRPPQMQTGVTKSYTLADDVATDAGDIPVRSSVAVRGRVVRGASLEGCAGVKVVLRGEPSGKETESYTDSSGAFAFAALTEYRHRVSLPEYHLQRSLDVTEQGEQLVFQLGSSTLHGTTVRGRVPVRAWITLIKDSMNILLSSDDRGRFTVTDMAPGKWFYSAKLASDAGRGSQGYIDIPDGVIERTICVDWMQVTGRVEDAAGQPVQGAQVTLRHSGNVNRFFWDKGTSTQTDGSFVLDELPSGTYSVVASKQEVGCAVVDGIKVQEDAPPASVVLRLANQGGALASTALSFTTGQPIAGASCALSNEQGRFAHDAKRGANGVMIIAHIPPGEYKAEVKVKGFSTAIHRVTIEDGKTATIEDVLHEVGELLWTLTDAHGMPLRDVPCRLVPADPGSVETERTGSTDGNGKWSVASLTPGKYTATATPQGRKPVSMDVIVSAAKALETVTRIE